MTGPCRDDNGAVRARNIRERGRPGLRAQHETLKRNGGKAPLHSSTRSLRIERQRLYPNNLKSDRLLA